MGAVRQTVWDWRAAGNFAGGGTGSGLAVCTAAIAAFVQPPAGQLASLVAAIAILGGLLLVAHEMGRPLRFFRVVFHPEKSWMTREALVAPLLLAALFAAAASGRRELMIVAGVLGMFLLFVQTQMLAAARGIPAWSQPLIVPLLILSGLVEGAGLFLLISLIGSSPVAFYTLLLSIVRWRYWGTYVAEVRRENWRAGAALQSFDVPFKIWGTAFPVLLLVLGFVVPALAPSLDALAGIAAVATGWELKRRIVTRAGFTHGFAIPGSPA